MAWRIRHSIAKRRGRALVASILAVLFLVLAPTVGAAIVSGINSKLPQVSLLELDDQIDERDIIFGDARNGSTITWNGANYSTEIRNIYFHFTDTNGTDHDLIQSYTVDSEGRIFVLLDSGGYTVDTTKNSYIRLHTYITGTQLKDANVQKIRVYTDLGSSGEITVKAQEKGSDTVVFNSFATNISANGSWTDIKINSLDLLTAASVASDGELMIYFGKMTTSNDISLVDGDAVLFDIELIGPESGGVAKNWLNYYFLLGGLVGLVGAVFATPYVNIRSFRKAKHKHVKHFKKNKRKRRFWRRRRR